VRSDAQVRLRPKPRMRLTGALVCALVLGAPLWPVVAEPDKKSEAQELVDSRQLDGAEKLIVAEMMTSPRDPDWITLLAEVRLGQNRTAEALKLIDDANQLGAPTATRAMLISLAESQAGHMDRAEAPIRNAIQLEPNNATAHYFYARLLYTLNRFDESIEESKKTIELAPDFVRAYENLGLCYEGKYQIEEAERWYLKAIDRQASSNNKSEWPMLDLATMLIHENRFAEAKPYLMQALEINPNNTQALLQMGTLLEEAGDFKGALDQYRASIRNDQASQQPGLASAYYKAARLCKKLGYSDEATQDFNRFTALLNKHKNGSVAVP